MDCNLHSFKQAQIENSVVKAGAQRPHMSVTGFQRVLAHEYAVKLEVALDCVAIPLLVARLEAGEQIGVRRGGTLGLKAHVDLRQLVAELFFYVGKYRVDNVLEFGDGLVAGDFVELGVERRLARHRILVVFDHLAYAHYLFKLLDVLGLDFFEYVRRNADFQGDTELQEVEYGVLAEETGVDHPLHAAEYGRLGKYHPLARTGMYHAEHLQAAEALAEHASRHPKLLGKGILVWNGIADAQIAALEVRQQALLDLVHERCICWLK